MHFKLLPLIVLAGVAVSSLAPSAAAQTSLDRPGSLLVFLAYDNSRGSATALTVTNSNDDTTPVAGGLMAGTVDVEFVYIDGRQGPSICQEFNRTRRLTPNDTLTVITFFDNPNTTQGYCYVFAKSPITGQAIKWDFLMGDSLLFDGIGVPPDGGNSNSLKGGFLGIAVADIPPVVYKAGAALATGAATDVDGDGIRDLNGIEYEQSPDKLLVPRFVATDIPGFPAQSELILVALTGGPLFTTSINFLIYNNNEEQFSASYTFRCWRRVPLALISNVFTNAFLQFTNTNPAESAQTVLETGWFRMDGNIAQSTQATFLDPAFLAARVDRFLTLAGASLPYALGQQANGDLLAQGVFGDNN